jgi:hypothetical protein
MIAIFIGENFIILNLLNQGFLRNHFILSLKWFFGRYQRLVENYSVSCVQITKEGIDN